MISRLLLPHAEEHDQCESPPSDLPDQVAMQRLAESPYACMRHLRCEFHEGVLTLRGRLPSFFMMQVAQTIAVGVEGVELVTAHIEVPYESGARID